MDFFERAHVVRVHHDSKEKKSEAAMKKQLKQMLRGYKSNDNKIIKEAWNNKNEFDDIVSLSDFSDVSLTNSSAEDDKSPCRLTDDSALLHASSQTKLSHSMNELKESVEVNSDLVTDFDEDNESLTEYTHEALNNISSESETMLLSDMKQSKSSEYVSSNSEFDKDGKLASKILTRLPKKISIITKNISKTFTNFTTDNNISDLILDVIDSNSKMVKSDPEILQSSQENSVISSPYVSIKAENMPEQSLNEILGDYRYSTVKHLSSDQQNIVDSSLFSVSNIESAEIQIEEEVDSLIPELGEDPVIEELEMTDVDLSLPQQMDNGFNAIDDTIHSVESFSIQHSGQIVEPDHENNFKIYYGNNMCILVMKHPSKIYINGKVNIKALGGTVEVFGYTIKDKFCDLYAPNYNCAQCIITVIGENGYHRLFGKLTSSGLSVKDAEEIVTMLGEYDAVLSLTTLSSRTIDFVENNIKSADLFSKQKKNIDKCFRKASDIIGCSLYLTPPIYCYKVNPCWQEVIDSGYGNESRTLVCGGKGAGKSTFVRYYVNKLLAKGPVLVIDLDPGQAELTVAGHVSVSVVNKPLLGPSFTHLSTPDFMLNIGLINIMDNPFRYINAITELIAHCHSNNRYKKMPWVINTMGMTNDMGLKLITIIIMSVQPTFVLQMDAKHHRNRFEVDLYPTEVKRLFDDFYQDRLFKNVTKEAFIELSYEFILCSNISEGGISNKRLLPKDERYLNYLAYFGQLLDMSSGYFLDIIPYEIKLCNFNIGTNVKIPHDVIAKVINGKIIALCQHDAADKGRVFCLRDSGIRCLGHGLVRGVDFERGVLYVITPTPVDVLPSVNTLVYCDWVPELTGEERNLPKGTVVPYRAISVSKQKRHMHAPRRRYNPIQLFKMQGLNSVVKKNND